MRRLAGLAARLAINDLYYAAVQHAPRASGPLGRGVARGVMATVPTWRRALRANARLALGAAAPEAEVRRVAACMLANMQRAIAEVLHSQRETADTLANRVTRFSGQEAYHRARAVSRGVVVASAHMGAFEPCLALLCRFEARVHVLSQPDPMPRFESARSRLRRMLGVVEHRADQGVAAWASLQDALAANEVVVLHGDRALPFQRASRMPFLGAENALLPTGPARLALACGAALVPTFCHRHEEHLVVEMHEPVVCPPEALRAAEVAVHPMQRAFVRALEHAVRSHPEQWMAFVPVLEDSA